VISVSAVGSMKEEVHPLDLVVPDQFYDHTKRRASSFFGDGIVAHVGMADPVCPGLADLLEAGGRESGATVHRGARISASRARSSPPGASPGSTASGVCR